MSIDRAIAVSVAVLLLLAVASCDSPERGADSLQARGKALLDRQEFAEARAALDQALARHKALADRASASRDASLLSEVYQKTNEYRPALVLAEVARVEATASEDRASLATALIAEGNTLQRIGDRAGALAAYDEAAPYLPASDRAGRARLAIYRALLNLSQGNKAAGEDLLQQGLDLARAAKHPGLTLGALVNLADLALAERRLDDAERHLRDARAASRERGDSKPSPIILCNEALLVRLRGDMPAARAILEQVAAVAASPDTARVIAECLGAAAEHAGDLDEAEKQFRKAIEIIEGLRRDFAPERARAPFLEQRWEPYESLFALQLTRSRTEEAFATLARAQGRMFLDVLAASLAEEASRERSRVQSGLGRIDAFERVWPPLADSQLATDRTAQAILAALRGRHVLTYFAAAGRMRLLAVVDGTVRSTGVYVDLEQLDELIDDFRARPDDPETAEALGRLLLPPEALPVSSARLHIIPTGPLLRVPFAALTLAGERLLDRFEVAYAPSVSGLAAMTDERGDRGGPAPGPALVLADTRRNLRHAAAELADVVEQTGALPRVGPDATRVALREAAGASLLHVIAHSGLGPNGGYLVLTDGEVSAADIVEWRIGPRLTVLPTCASAASNGKEMWSSLATAFLAAGSRHVVGTVASVEDHIGAEFSRLFYRAGGLRDPVGAVTRAQREMARSHKVGIWSAFVVAGL